MENQVKNITTGWKDILLNYPKLGEISKFLKNEEETFGNDLKTYPKTENIFRCFNFCNPNDIRVVILGQDPYHGENQANGLCFAVNKGIKSPPSLNNIKNELVTNIGIDLKCSNLEYWAEQGVLLLNTALTVRHKSPASHMGTWLPFTKYIIDYLNNSCSGIIFVAWGAFAYDKLKSINTEKHHLIVSSHPSPLSARRKYKDFPAFLGSKPFSKINSLLENKIKW